MRICCTRIGCFLFALGSFFPVVLIYCFKTFVCSAQEAETLILYCFVVYLILQAATGLFLSVGAALQHDYSNRKRVAIFTLTLTMWWFLLLLPYFLPHTRQRIENEWAKGKAMLEQHFSPTADKATWPRRCRMSAQ